MQLWKSILAYDGTNFHGWQVQPGLPTVQGTLAQALHHITGETVLPQGSGRTDTGVHALAQVATFALAAPIPPANLHRALNRALPPAIRILSVSHAPVLEPAFHARHSALRKTYEYRLFPRVVLSGPGEPAHPDRICPPFLAHWPTEQRLPDGSPDRICPPFLAHWPTEQRLPDGSPDRICPPFLAHWPTEQRLPDGSPDRICPPFLAHWPTEQRLPDGSPDRICPPFLAPYVWDFPFPFNFEAATEAAAHILGTHDFTSFAASDPDLTTRTAAPKEAEEKHKSVPHSSQPHRDPGYPPSVLGSVGWDEWDPTTNLSSPPSSLSPLPSSNTRTIHASTWTHHEGLYLYRITGSGFLHHMVRNLVGTFTDVAAGRLPPDCIPQILAARNRSAAGPTAPARGLFLVQVEYPEIEQA